MQSTIATATEWSPARDELRGLLGAVVDDLSSAACGRVLGALYAAVRRELDRVPDPAQLALDGAQRRF